MSCSFCKESWNGNISHHQNRDTLNLRRDGDSALTSLPNEKSHFFMGKTALRLMLWVNHINRLMYSEGNVQEGIGITYCFSKWDTYLFKILFWIFLPTILHVEDRTNKKRYLLFCNRYGNDCILDFIFPWKCAVCC